MAGNVGILCGGESRRMGRNKAFLPWKDETGQEITLLTRLLREFKDADSLFLSVSSSLEAAVRQAVEDHDRQSRPGRPEDAGYIQATGPDRDGESAGSRQCQDGGANPASGIRLLVDEAAGCGPLEGLKEILKALDGDRIFVCAVDMPFITGQVVSCLENVMEDQDDCVILKERQWRHPLCGIYRKRILPVLEEQLQKEDYRMRGFLEQLSIRNVYLEDSGLPPWTLMNLNTEEDYEQALALRRKTL